MRLLFKSRDAPAVGEASLSVHAGTMHILIKQHNHRAKQKKEQIANLGTQVHSVRCGMLYSTIQRVVRSLDTENLRVACLSYLMKAQSRTS